MDHEPGRKIDARRYARLAGRARPQIGARPRKPWACRSMDGATDAAARGELLVRRIDDRIDGERRDVHDLRAQMHLRS